MKEYYLFTDCKHRYHFNNHPESFGRLDFFFMGDFFVYIKNGKTYELDTSEDVYFEIFDDESLEKNSPVFFAKFLFKVIPTSEPIRSNQNSFLCKGIRVISPPQKRVGNEEELLPLKEMEVPPYRLYKEISKKEKPPEFSKKAFLFTHLYKRRNVVFVHENKFIPINSSTLYELDDKGHFTLQQSIPVKSIADKLFHGNSKAIYCVFYDPKNTRQEKDGTVLTKKVWVHKMLTFENLEDICPESKVLFNRKKNNPFFVKFEDYYMIRHTDHPYYNPNFQCLYNTRERRIELLEINHYNKKNQSEISLFEEMPPSHRKNQESNYIDIFGRKNDAVSFAFDPGLGNGVFIERDEDDNPTRILIAHEKFKNLLEIKLKIYDS